MNLAEATPDSGQRRSSPGIVLALAGLLWMAGLIFSARATITGRQDAETEVTSTAYAMPGAISASLVAGAAVALAVLTLIARGRVRGRDFSATVRFALTAGTGLLLGGLGALAFVTINSEGWVYAVIGGTVAAAATIGGALAGVRTPRVVRATCWAAIAVFVVGFLLNVVQDPLLNLFGAADTPASQAGASDWFSTTQGVLSGLAAGLVSYSVLRRGDPSPWTHHALAGAGPGVLLTLAETLTRTAGARVLELAGRVSELELAVQQMLSSSRLNNALVVLFVGAVTAIIAVGRTLRPADDD